MAFIFWLLSFVLASFFLIFVSQSCEHIFRISCSYQLKSVSTLSRKRWHFSWNCQRFNFISVPTVVRPCHIIFSKSLIRTASQELSVNFMWLLINNLQVVNNGKNETQNESYSIVSNNKNNDFILISNHKSEQTDRQTYIHIGWIPNHRKRVEHSTSRWRHNFGHI